jgi:hypothetical protein
MEREQTDPVKELNNYATHYLRDTARVLMLQGHSLGLAGMNLERSRLGILNARSLEVIKLLVSDNKFLFEPFEKVDEPYEYFLDIKNNLDQGEIKVPEIILDPKENSLLTRLLVLYEWEKENPSERGSAALSESPVGLGTEITRDLLGKLVDKEKVSKEYEKLKGEDEKLEEYYEVFRLAVKDSLTPGFTH